MERNILEDKNDKDKSCKNCIHCDLWAYQHGCHYCNVKIDLTYPINKEKCFSKRTKTHENASCV
jgi:hypothetical protein